MASLMFKISNEEAAAIRYDRADIAEALATVINKALMKNVEQRFQGGADFSSALKIYLKPWS